MKINLRYVLIMMFALYQGCKHDKTIYYTKKDKDITLQLGLEHSPLDTGGITLKVRILKDTKVIDQGSFHDKSSFYYHMDSCFYLNTKKGKTYASLVEPVANGTSNSYEYLLNFDLSIQKSDSLDFVYHDRYINKKTYTIKLN